MSNRMIQKVLDNGLTILLKEIHSAPIISHWVWYRVGVRNEIPGLTGLSHWVEHMQFKGTPKYPAGVLDKTISRCGGQWNAFTFLDWTAFYETLPADYLDIAIDLEADRMRNSLFLPEEVASERTVILSEREGSENDPSFRLDEAILKAAFGSHPYRTEVIGEREDLLRITRDDLYGHYTSYYRPNNAVVCLAGDFDAESALKKIAAAYEGIPMGTIPACTARGEGLIPEAKRVELSGPGEVNMMNLVWRFPAGNDPDVYALTVLDSILTGPSSLNMFGGGSVPNKTSRLYRSLIPTGKAASMYGGYSCTIDPYLYQVNAVLREDNHPDEISELTHGAIAEIVRDGVSEDELRKAVKQARAMFAYASENITNQGYWMGYTSMFADAGWFDAFVPGLEQVTVEDVRRVAGKYFAPEACVTGIYHGNSNAEAEA